MKKLFTIICIIALFTTLSCKTYAQYYNFQAITGTYQSLTSPIALHTNDSVSWWDDAIGSFTLPFTFKLFEDTVPTLYFYDAYLTDDTANENYEINVFGAGIWGNSSPVSYQMEGTTPNRIYKVEWTDIGFDNYSDVASANIQFQLWLYETTNVIEIHFGNSYVPDAATAYDGLIGPEIDLINYNDIPSYYFSLQGIPAAPTATNDSNVVLTGTPPLNTVYRFSPHLESVPQITPQKEITFYPNPANDNFTISYASTDASALISVFDIQGKLLLQQAMQADRTQINISNLEKGVYIVKVLGKNINMVKSIIKE